MKKTLILLIAATALCGCRLTRPVPQVQLENCYINGRADFESVGKVVVLELDNCSHDAAISASLSETIVQSLQKRNLFSVSMLEKNDPQWLNLSLDDVQFFPTEKLVRMREHLGADAVIFGSVTAYYPYPNLTTGLRLRMFDLRTGRLLWAIEQLWDSTDKSVEQRMRAFYEYQMRSGYEPVGWQLFVTSPRAFNRFVGYELARTLPAAGRGKISLVRK